MLLFEPNVPFPLLADDSISYSQAQSHAKAADAWLGLQTEKVEQTLLAKRGTRLAPRAIGRSSCKSSGKFNNDPQQLWIGLATQSLLTPYTEIRSLLHLLSPQPTDTIIDLGAGYARIGFVIGYHYPHANFVGYEYVGERVVEAQRCLSKMKFKNVKIEHADLSAPDFTPQTADFYFIYDYGTFKAIEKTLHDLRRHAQSKKIVVIGRGRLCRDIIERRHPWLSQVIAPLHLGHSSIYRSA